MDTLRVNFEWEHISDSSMCSDEFKDVNEYDD